jgi:hypothetical protein
MNKNGENLVWIVLGLGVFIFVVGIGSNFLVDKVAEKVIQKLQKDYSPSPYGPGFDPDKIDVSR